MNIQDIKRIHCIGVGGIGISAVARSMLRQGKRVSGSDSSTSLVIDGLLKEGVDFLGMHSQENISSDIDLVVYTTAIQNDNPEFLRAKELNIPILSYPEMLGKISKGKYTIAVSGTHGKTTTTAMVGKIFEIARRDPTVVLGSLFADTRTNFIHGNSDYFIIEACEYRRSFLNLEPNILIITNIDTDHLDYYRDLTDIQSAFRELVKKVPRDGFLVCDKYHATLIPVIKSASCTVIDYKEYSKKVPKLKVLGAHNRSNAAVALAVADVAHISIETAQESLANFGGTWRRGEYRGKTKSGALVFDDYAHHPTEIRTTLQGFKERFTNRSIIVVFQPHLFSRTEQLFGELAESFGDAIRTIVTDVYAAREKDIGRNLAKELAESLEGGNYVKDFSDIVEILHAETQENDVIITMGAGDIYKVADLLLE